MADIKITADNSDEFLREFEEKAQAALEACGIQAVGYAQDIIDAKVPRHAESWYTSKGAAGLRGSISHQVQKDVCYIGTNNEHAIYNEIGTGIFVEDGGGRQSPWAYQDEEGNWHQTRGISALHFLKYSVEQHVKEYKEIIKRYIKG